MSLFRRLLPEFTYFCPSPELRRRVALAIAFSAFGLVAGASGLALIMAEDDSDPRSAFALASLPPPGAESAMMTPAAELPAAEALDAPKAAKLEIAKVEIAKVEIAKPEAIKPCENGTCGSIATRPPEVVRAVAAPPGTREGPIGHGSEPAEAAPRSATFVANSPSPQEGTATPIDATAPAPMAATPPPAPPAAKPYKTARHQGRRAAPYQQFSLWPFGGGSGRQRGGFRLFW